MVQGLKFISLKRFEVTTSIRGSDQQHLRRKICNQRTSVIHYHTTKNIPPIFRKFAKVKVVMDNIHLTMTHPPTVNSPQVVGNFSWYDEVTRSEEVGELAIDDTPIWYESEVPDQQLCHEPLASSNVQGFSAALDVPAPIPQRAAKKSRQGSGSRQRQREKFAQKMEERRKNNQKFEEAIQSQIAKKYGLPSTPKPNSSNSDLFSNLVHIQEQVDQEKSRSPDQSRRGKSRKSLDAYLKILKGTQKSILSEPLDMSSFTKNLEDSEDVSSFFKPKIRQIWTGQVHHSQ